MAIGQDRAQYTEQIEKACRLYAELGFSPERIAAQLIRSGYPECEVRARFPDLPVTAIPSRPLRNSPRPPSLAPIGRLLPAPPGTGGAVLPSASESERR